MSRSILAQLVLTLILLLVGVDQILGCGRSPSPRSCPPRDRTPPTLTCPGNIAVNNRPIQNHQQVTWVEPKANDNGRTITPTRNGPGPGLLFNEGVTKITYSAKDNSGNTASCSFTITVNVVRCPWHRRQSNQWKVCHPSDDMRYGGSCRFGCYSGFTLNGPSRVECLESGSWTVTEQPTCEKKTCPTLHAPINVHDITCTDAYNYRSICSYNCKEGFGVPQGTSKVRLCGGYGNWIGREPLCVDVTRPVIDNCPHFIAGYAESTKTSGVISWNNPTATDNNDAYVPVVKISGPSPGDDLPVGEHPVTYTATDSSGNMATCTFSVIVKQIRCPAIYPLPYTSVTCPDGTILGSSCDFTCDNNTALNGHRYTQCQRSTSSLVPFGVWSFDNRQPYCELIDLCPDLLPPENGAVACDTWYGGSVCQMFCQSGYVSTERNIHTILHVCNTGGDWFHGNELPDCFKMNRTLRFFKIEAEFPNLVYDGTCSETHSQINEAFLQELRDRYPNHTIKSFKITCGESVDNGRKKRRQAPAEFTIGITVEMSATMGTEEVLQARSDMVSTLKSNFTLLVNGTEHTVGAVSVSQIEANCSSGSVFDKKNAICIQCKHGYYHNAVTNTCTKCPKGQYQESTGRTFCSQCPIGKTTREEGAVSQDMCQEACARGMYSSHGTTPCSQCEVGTYADETASTTCHVCPGTKSTLVPGATTVDTCQDMDIRYIAPEGEDDVVPAMITANTTNAVGELFLWFHYTFTQCSNILNVTNGDTLLLELTRSDDGDLNARVFGSSFTSTSTVSTGSWHQFNVSLGNSRFEMFVDDVKVFSEIVNDLSGDWVPNETNITLGGGDCEGSFSQFNLNTTAGSGLHPSTSCFTEDTGDILSWKQFLETGTDGTFFRVHSQCDVINNCDSAPCQNGAECSDLYNDFSCACVDGYSGKSCEIDLDDCQTHACDNDATCVDGSNEYTCLCPHGFKGDLCEIKVVDGNWAEWGNRSACSVSCGLGTATRTRTCSDPAPDNGGLECEGNSTETVECQDRPDTDEECINECANPPVVVNGNMDCSVDETDGETVVCTPTCKEGYDFDSDFMIINSTIFCGLGSSYRWNIRNEENPNMTLPTCMEKAVPSETTMLYTGDYGTLQPDFVTDGGGQIEQVFRDRISSVGCIGTGQCVMSFSHDSVANTDRRRRSTVGTTITITVTCVPRSSNISECYDILSTIYALLNTAVSNLELTVNYNGLSYDMNTDSTGVDGYVNCNTGYVAVLEYCIPCGEGMYQSGEFCERCPRGYYQDEQGQTSCKQCPKGWTTYGLQSKNVTECAVGVPIDDEITSIVMMVLLIVGGCLLIGVITVIGGRLFYKQKSSKRPVTPIGDLSRELTERNKNTYFRPGAYGVHALDEGNAFPERNIDIFTLPNVGLHGATNDALETEDIREKNVDIHDLPDIDDGSDIPPPQTKRAW